MRKKGHEVKSSLGLEGYEGWLRKCRNFIPAGDIQGAAVPSIIWLAIKLLESMSSCF